MAPPSRVRLAPDEVEKVLSRLPGWTCPDGALRRAYRFPSFARAFGFMASVAVVAERHDHHPDWSNSWCDVRIALTTHDAGGVTALDVALATECNDLAAAAGGVDAGP